MSNANKITCPLARRFNFMPRLSAPLLAVA